MDDERFKKNVKATWLAVQRSALGAKAEPRRLSIPRMLGDVVTTDATLVVHRSNRSAVPRGSTEVDPMGLFDYVVGPVETDDGEYTVTLYSAAESAPKVFWRVRSRHDIEVSMGLADDADDARERAGATIQLHRAIRSIAGIDHVLRG